MGKLGSVWLIVLSSMILSCGIEPTSAPWSPPPEPAQAKAIAPREDCLVQVAEKQPLFGDLHIHTGVSMDANSMGPLSGP